MNKHYMFIFSLFVFNMHAADNDSGLEKSIVSIKKINNQQYPKSDLHEIRRLELEYSNKIQAFKPILDSNKIIYYLHPSQSGMQLIGCTADGQEREFDRVTYSQADLNKAFAQTERFPY